VIGESSSRRKPPPRPSDETRENRPEAPGELTRSVAELADILDRLDKGVMVLRAEYAKKPDRSR